jgi:bacterioferritin (cytochrome b1)
MTDLSAIDRHHLRDLLRVELTAVNQQFIHILALRRSGDAARAARIYEIDRIDFPNVMRIIDHLIRQHGQLHLAADLPTPGWPLQCLLQSEAQIEARLQTILAVDGSRDPAVAALFDQARSPRADYRAWLATELQACRHQQGGDMPTFPATNRLFSCLIAVLEQMMIHAFVYWHAGQRDRADIAWAISGVAMTQATEIVNALTDLQSLPQLAPVVALRIAGGIDNAEASDQDLIRAYAAIATDASAQETQSELRSICLTIAAYCQSLAGWTSTSPHPARAICAPSFRHFEQTLRKFVW